MFKVVRSLLNPLVISLALHVGSIILAETYYGSAQAFPGHNSVQRRAPLRVSLLASHVPATFVRPSDLHTIKPESEKITLPEGIVSLPGPYYFPPHELSRRPQATLPVAIDYPENVPLVAWKHVVLRLLINEAGDVDKVIVETADVPGELEILARQAFVQAKFQPGLRGEMPVKSQMRVEITFESGSAPPPPGTMLPAR